MESQFWIHKVRLDGFHLKFHTKTHQAHTDLRFLGTNYKVILETCRLIGEQRLPQQDEAYKVSICVYGLSVRKRTNMMERNDELLYLLWLKICPQTSNIFRIARARFNGPFFPLRAEKKKVPVIVTAGERFLAEDHSSARPSRQDKTLVFGQLCSYTPGEPINDTS